MLGCSCDSIHNLFNLFFVVELLSLFTFTHVDFFFLVCHILILRFDTSKTYSTILLLTTFIFVFNIIMEWRFYLSPLTISVFSFISFNSVLNIYVYIFSLLYLPQDFDSSKGY